MVTDPAVERMVDGVSCLARNPSFRIGLTGGIGSGKSTFSAALAACGAHVLDADAIARDLTMPGGKALPALVAALGPEVLAADGHLNRTAMRVRMLQDPHAKKTLESILHPLIRQAMLDQAAASPCALVVLDIPLLAESSPQWRWRLDAIWVMDCSPETQIQRVMARSGWPREQIMAIMATQATRHARLALADAVICNENLSILQLQGLAKHLCRNFTL